MAVGGETETNLFEKEAGVVCAGAEDQPRRMTILLFLKEEESARA